MEILILGAVVVYLVGYWLSLKIWPYTACPGGGGATAAHAEARARKWRLGVRLFMHSRTL